MKAKLSLYNVVFASVLVQYVSVLSSILRNSRLHHLVYLWCEDIQSNEIMEKQLKWAPATVVDWKNFMKDICVEEIIEDPEPLGEPGVIVEIDESKFGRGKYNRGRLVVCTWVFGILE